MCLVEIEGNPKLQAGCTLTAQDGLVVRTAQTSAKAAEGQNATLEFILVNHPLDCPVCDKGGECPLQDLTFRYGPGSTRMTFSKLTADKPIPISPHIALDRERCILCYRCTRFSESVAEDGELVAVNRGARTEIATFGEEPYRDRFSGNVIELCPVGALTSTEYRFEGRPWEIQNVPSVCGLCPVGCNIGVTTREGKVKRILSRNHPEVDRGWLCDKGRFAFPSLRAGDRIVDPLPARPSARARGGVVGRRARGGGAARARGRRLGARRPLRVGDERARLRAREARGGGRRLGAGAGSRRAAARPPALRARGHGRGRATETSRSTSSRRSPSSGRRRRGATARTAASRRFASRAPRTGSGSTTRWRAPGRRQVTLCYKAPPALLIVSGDDAAADPAVRELAESAQTVIAVTMFQGLAVGWADLVLPGTSYLERDGSLTNMEGRVQRVRRAVIPPGPGRARVAVQARGALRRRAVALRVARPRRAVRHALRGAGRDRARFVPRAASSRPARRAPAADGLRLVRYRPLFSGPAVERVEKFRFQRPDGLVDLARDDAHRLGVRDGDEVTVRTNGTSATLRARVRRNLRNGVVLVPEGSADELVPGTVEVTPA